MHTMMKTILLAKKMIMVKTILTTERKMIMTSPKRIVKKMKKKKKYPAQSKKKGNMSAFSLLVPPRLQVPHSRTATCMEHGHCQHYPTASCPMLSVDAHAVSLFDTATHHVRGLHQKYWGMFDIIKKSGDDEGLLDDFSVLKA